MVRSVHTGPIIALTAQLSLLAVLAATLGLGGAAWGIGVACAITTAAALSAGLLTTGRTGLGPADWVTLLRVTLVGAVAALVADSFGAPAPAALVGLAAVALALDAVDGRVARRTGTVSAFGARFDLEVDAFLILVLSVQVAQSAGLWVLAIGVARYLFVGAGWLLPWLRATAPPRYWCKVVAAIQGIVLTAVAAGIGSPRLGSAALLLALLLLIESFGHEGWWLWRHRELTQVRNAPPAAVITVLALLLVWLALVLPNRTSLLAPAAFLRIPLEGLVLIGVCLLLPPGLRRAAASGFGLLLGLLVLVKLLDMGFFAVFDRPFDAGNDWFSVGPGLGVLGDSIGPVAAVAVLVSAVLLGTLVLIVVVRSVRRLVRMSAAHRRTSARTVIALSMVWLLCAVTGLEFDPGTPVATANATELAYQQMSQVQRDVADRQRFARQIATDPLRARDTDELLTGLRGKDVLLVFVESYGRVAVHGSSFSPGVNAVLAAGTRTLRTAGFSARSAYLTSPTFGAGSWLAHATLQSGLWVDSQQRYGQLLDRDRLTLTSAFGRAGWRTVFDVPANTRDWPQGARFYRFDQLYDSRNVGYRGPKFGYASMPDQYVLSAFDRLELAHRDRPPVMAEIDLVSSHHPWTPLPQPVPWDEVGDGSVFDAMPAQGEAAITAFRDPDEVRALYGRSIEYTLSTLFSWLAGHRDPNLVLIVVGDHQPHSYVTGARPGHDVPISIVAHDRAVLDRISGWGWEEGMLPSAVAPVWPMNAFRDRFLNAYGPAAGRVLGAPAATRAGPPQSRSPQRRPR